MTHSAQLSQYSDVGASASPSAAVAWTRRLRAGTQRLASRIAASFNARAVSLGQAVLYEELSKLSDAELSRRGLSRGDLHRWVAGQ
jgi:hypothetical protein